MSIETSLRAFLSDRNISYKESGQSLITDCVNPSCKKEMHMYIRRTDGFSTCFKCGNKLGWRELVSAYDGCSLAEASTKLGLRHIDNIEKHKLEFNINSDEERYVKDDEYIELGDDFIAVEQSKEGMTYLINRGITDPQTIFDFDIRWHETMQSVVFPIKLDGYVYGWQARKINPGPDEPRLLTKTGMNKSNFLLNLNNIQSKQELIVVEGPFDCLKVSQAGFGCVATFGSMVSNKQIELILDTNIKDIYNGIDPDAYKQADILSKKLLSNGNKDIYRILPPNNKKDFGECNTEEIQSAKHNAIHISSSASYLDIFLKNH